MNNRPRSANVKLAEVANLDFAYILMVRRAQNGLRIAKNCFGAQKNRLLAFGGFKSDLGRQLNVE